MTLSKILANGLLLWKYQLKWQYFDRLGFSIFTPTLLLLLTLDFHEQKSRRILTSVISCYTWFGHSALICFILYVFGKILLTSKRKYKGFTTHTSQKITIRPLLVHPIGGKNRPVYDLISRKVLQIHRIFFQIVISLISTIQYKKISEELLWLGMRKKKKNIAQSLSCNFEMK